MGGITDIKKDLPMSMTMAAFSGVAWYIAVELNFRLFGFFKHRKGLYFWSCVLCSWGVIIQPLAILMADFGVWTNLRISIPIIYVSWWIMVIPQSLVLYSRLHLIMQHKRVLQCVLGGIIFNILVFSVPTLFIGIMAQTTHVKSLGPFYSIWDRVQVTVFFVQETAISILYVIQTRKLLKNTALLSHKYGNNPGSKQIMRHLIYVNVLVICLDISLLGIQFANFFYLQGAYKPCVYGIKLRVEFSVLNRLINMMKGHQQSSHQSDSNNDRGSRGGARSTKLGSLSSWASQA